MFILGIIDTYLVIGFRKEDIILLNGMLFWIFIEWVNKEVGINISILIYDSFKWIGFFILIVYI